ncbi:Ca-activated chloride channel family protein [Capnocytophaga leadbetteri]|uniref:Ca-activated chloride channel family protein n=1 Tax=Capnocytophaga leadbetteri TaxID=327575 RepID=A0A2T5XUH0_9FLAO|nr:VWA domain-containing protein [Capnocytophaga leadbetteri]PTX06895.1 Ca-activated chloride channel family protein [Capnocytophaga leadbetteri]
MKTNVSLCIAAALMVAACGDPSHRHNSGEMISVINPIPNEVIEEDVEITSNEAALMEPSANATSKMILSSPPQQRNAETYKEIKENSFVAVAQQPVTTFSADVDRAAYANVRRIIGYGQIPPKDAVRIEEMVNYFDYDYPAPEEGSVSPLRVSPELAPAPWNPNHLLLRIGLQTKKIDLAKAPPSNIVFLIDVSGSMDEENKLPLLQSSFKMLLGQLRPDDKVAIVTYANGTKVALPSTRVKDKEKIIKVLDNLYASGGTSGGRGIQLAYEQAQKSFIKNGNNRIILATDGDFNIGINNTTDLEKFIEKQRESGIYMSVLGFGMGNYRDDMAETIADKGNGNYAYIDNITEAKKVLINELSGTLFAVAKDVKLQLEFNPKYVKEYKLIGYENRMLANEDFTNDKKDAGEIGAGHTVTALYELVPSDGKVAQSLRYQSQELNEKGKGNELGFLKIRYKDPKVKDAKSVEITEPLVFNKKALKETSTDYRFAASVAEFGILLRDNSNKANATYDQVIELAEGAIGKDPEGYRKEFVRLVKSVKMLPK